MKLGLVYCAVCVVALQLAHRLVRPLSRRASVALALLPLVLTGNAFMTGGYFGPLNLAYKSAPLQGVPVAPYADGLFSRPSYDDGIFSDLQIAIVPWRKAVRDSVKAGRVPLLNRFTLCGDPLLASFQPAPFSPATVAGFALPLATAWTLGSAVTLLFTVLFVFLYVREIGVGELGALFGASVAMLSFFTVFWFEWPLGAAFGTFPLLALGLRRIARGEPRGVAIAVSGWVLLVLAGHPETILHVTAAAALLFSIEWLSAQRSPKAILVAAGAGLLSLALTAPVVLPFAQVLPQTSDLLSRRWVYAREVKSIPVTDAMASAAGAVYPWTYGFGWHAPPPTPVRFAEARYSFIGGLALALALLSIVSRRSGAAPIACVAVASFLVAMGVPGITDAVSRVPLFDIAVNSRLTVLSGTCLAILSGVGLERAIARPKTGMILALVAIGLVALGWSRRPIVRARGLPLGQYDFGLLMLGLPVLVLAILLLARVRPESIGVTALAMFLVSQLIQTPPPFPSFPVRQFYPPIEEISALPAGGEPYRTTALGLDLVPNQSALYELEDPRGYQAISNARLLSTFPLWCTPQPVWFNRIDDASRPFLSFLNVRFIVAGPEGVLPKGWREFRRGKTCLIFENPRVLPRAFAPARVTFVGNSEGTVDSMQRCDDFSKMAWIEDPSRTGKEIDNGDAVVSSRRSGADLLLHVEASRAAWVVVSQTFWNGWEATEKGATLPLRFANSAFIAFEVAPGAHDIRLSFRPASFRIGVGICASALTGLVAAFVLRRHRPAAVSGSP